LLIARQLDLIDLAHIAEISELERQHALFTCRISSESALPDEMALLHACLPVRSALWLLIQTCWFELHRKVETGCGRITG
jgi:hypothetical protein